ncbi:MAG: hypothetical protein CMA81_02295, partial [Euryarchaeota archaeon]|nr:hypothetical protein [Euryarchaeota archaeon]
GLEGIATRELMTDGEVVDIDGKFKIKKGYGLWNATSNSYQLDEEGNIVHSYTETGITREKEEIGDPELQVVPYKKLFHLKIEVNPGAVTGDSGILEIVVMSESNSADRSGYTSVSLEVQTIYDIQFSTDVDLHYTLEYPDKKTILVDVINQGNVRTQFNVLTPEGLRGWSVSLDYANGSCTSNSDGLRCWLDVGDSIGLIVDVRPSYEAEVKDNFTFTLSVEPVETGVIDRENIEFSVLGEPYAGAFGLGIQQEHIKSGMYLLIILIFLGVIYQGAKPTLREMNAKSSAKRQLIYTEKLASAKESGFVRSMSVRVSPIPYRTPVRQWLIFTPLTLGLYPIVTMYKWGEELKKNLDIGPGGAKNLLFFIIPLFNIYWLFKFIGIVRELESKTMHETKLSGSSPIIWFILGVLVFPALGIAAFMGGALYMIPVVTSFPSFLSIPILAIFYLFVTWIFALPGYKIWSLLQNSMNDSWTIWFGKSA